MPNIDIKVDTKGFDVALSEYLKYSSRSLTEAVNQHAYFVARNATQTTHAADKSNIESKLRAGSRNYPDAPLAAIIVNTQLGKRGKKGLSGSRMASAVEKLIRIRKSHVNFLRAGWIPAVKLLGSIVPKRGGGKIPSGTDKKGRNFGGAVAAKDRAILFWKPIATLWNSSFSDKKTRKMVEGGAQKALNMEVESMHKYIAMKQEQAAKKLNHS